MRELSLTDQNDTLNGKLLEYEKLHPELMHERNSFGYWHMLETRLHTEELIAEGHDPKAMDFFTKLEKKKIEAHKNDYTFREISAAISKKWALQNTEKTVRFTQEEIDHLMFFLNESQNPISEQIIRKLSQ